MGLVTNIGWTDSTVNPTSGCEGCELWNGKEIRDCYAGNLHENRLAKSLPALYDADFQNVRLIPGRMKKAAAWPDLRGKDRPDKPWLNGYPRMIFVGDMGDFCSRSVPDDYIKSEIIDPIDSPAGRRHFWLLLTKQIHRLAEISCKLGSLPDNCMAMTTVTSQSFANNRINTLLQTCCRWKGISAEPLLGPVDLIEAGAIDKDPMFSGEGEDTEYEGEEYAAFVDWVIGGGASGAKAKPMDLDWLRRIIVACQKSGTPCFVKQLGKRPYEKAAKMPGDPAYFSGWTTVAHDGIVEYYKYYRMNNRAGAEPVEWPQEFRVQQCPEGVCGDSEAGSTL